MKQIKKRKTVALWLGVGLLLGAPSVSALGLGVVTTHSYLHQRLDASIPLLGREGLSDEDIKASLAARDVYQQLGIPFPRPGEYWVELQGTQLVVRSRVPVREPILELVVEIASRGERVVRDFVILLDPPPAIAALPANSEPPPAPAPQVAVQRRELPLEPPPIPLVGEYRVRRGDTLNGIARRLSRSSGMDASLLADALLLGNRHAFVADDPDRLRAGVLLRVPAAAAGGDPPAPAAVPVVAAVPPAAGESSAPPPEAEGAPQTAPQLSIVAPPEGAEVLLRETQQTNQQLLRDNEELRQRLTRMEDQLRLLTERVLAAADAEQPPPPKVAPVPKAAAPGTEPGAPRPLPAGEGVERVVADAKPAAPSSGAAQPPLLAPAGPAPVVKALAPPPRASSSGYLPWIAGGVGGFGLLLLALFGWRRWRVVEERPYATHWDD